MAEEKPDNGLDYAKWYAAESFWKEVFNHSNHPFSYQEKLNENMITKKSANKGTFPRCDMFEKEDELIIEAELPGIKPENFSVLIKGENLILSGTYSTLKPTRQYYLKEREDRSFERTLHLPIQINKEAVRSTFVNGLLTIIIPIIKEEATVPIYIDLHNTNHSNPDQY